MDRQDPALRRLGRRITHLREQHQLTISALATLTGLDPRDIAAIEAGDIDIHLTTIFAVARALGVTPQQLLNFSEDT
jgi:transcriptional regulator with XRE-family HTH domain